MAGFHQYGNLDHDRCVDLFSRLDGSCGFEEFRRDVEDRGECTPVQYYSGSVYKSQEAALAAAMQAVAWLADAIGQNPAAQKLRRRMQAEPLPRSAMTRKPASGMVSGLGGRATN